MEKKSGFRPRRAQVVIAAAGAVCILFAVCIFLLIPGFSWVGLLCTLVAAAAAAWKLFREYTSTARDVEAWEQAEAARAAEALSEEKKG
ncbi:MAG TPA: hypothetical protein K8V04_02055 [Flavonifractor plautii]|nr:hypothetical protein [Flavonifractor plautii]